VFESKLYYDLIYPPLQNRWSIIPHHTLYASKRIEAYGITLFLGLNDLRASRVRVPHALAVNPIGIHRAAYTGADGRLIRQYTPAATYVSHMSRIVALF
jgi:hypothetical protein